MESESVFLTYVRYTFKRWTGFQQAKMAGMGGDYADEKEIWLGNEVENYFKRYDKVHPDEIEDYLAAMIENEFNTYFEDNSIKEISRNFCVAYPLSLTNPDAKIFQDIKNKPVIKPLTVNESSQECSIYQEQNVQNTCEEMENLTISENMEEDGWTIVGRKKTKQH